jgi:hypothetical protein
MKFSKEAREKQNDNRKENTYTSHLITKWLGCNIYYKRTNLHSRMANERFMIHDMKQQRGKNREYKCMKDDPKMYTN